jgi:hypothetical protein
MVIVAFVTVIFVMPPELLSSLLGGLSRLPGGARAAAGISWVASSLGLGQAGDKQGSLAALLAAMRAAKDARNTGWGAFFQGGALGAGNGDSLGMVRGSLADAAAGDANLAAKVKGGDTISGIMTPKEAKESGDGVALGREDIAGQRERSARAGAAMEGGQAYVAAGFLNVNGHAADPDMVRATLGTGAVPIASRGGTNVVRPAVGRNPAFTPGQAGQTAQTWRMGARGGVTLGQLVSARNAALMSSDPICGPSNGCPAEFAATTSGANYDGAKLAELGGPPGANNQLTALNGSGSSPAMLSNPVSIDGASSPAVPDPNAPRADLRKGAAQDAAQSHDCGQAMSACQQERAVYRADLLQQKAQLAQLSSQLKGACGDPCNCTPCTQIQNQIASLCQGSIADDVSRLSVPCQLPPNCVPTASPPDSGPQSPPPACQPQSQGSQACGCGNVACDARCLLGI